MNDTYGRAINEPAGRLAEILLRKISKAEDGSELSSSLRSRLDKLVDSQDRFGRLARVTLAANVSFLFSRAPLWTTQRIIPLFDWSSPEAPDVWSARKYSNSVGSPDLFRLTKESFLQLFKRDNLPDDDLRVFSDWLTWMMVANQRGATYPILPIEARSALRAAGVKSLPNVGHRLAIEMGEAGAGEKEPRWREVVGPVFQSIWPLDIELQTSDSTFTLVHILRSSGIAFPEAADVILPFVRPDDPNRHTSIFSISNADETLYTSAPEKVLELLDAVVGDASAPHAYGLGKALERIRTQAPQLANTVKFQRLLNFAE